MNKLISTIVPFSLLFITISLSNSFAQDSNFLLPIKELERRFQFEDLDIFKSEDLRKNSSVKGSFLDGAMAVIREPNGKEHRVAVIALIMLHVMKLPLTNFKNSFWTKMNTWFRQQ